eukprot:gnl/MRDRNA2_/MRDRNA2_15100_c0_seq1.p1 gnl/MRDRNA2_/MRDRNA2_15100_c0~~gnl/MRDRNA2_/MRDRNA2_15100_c0_seq1.p1  ORF type:complete len:611 (+),score=74.11 gnl/MRDRNA2_/MRDRNA2_15100_c0_seq1:42-1835(+)
MQADTDAAKIALDAKADPNSVRDMYGLTPLHYAARHGDAELVRGLLGSKANALCDRGGTGFLPIHRALLLGHKAVVLLLLDQMESFEVCKCTLHGELTAAALERSPDGRAFFSQDLIWRVAKWEANHLPKTTSLLSCWAKNDRSEALLRSIEMGLSEIVGSVDTKDAGNSTPLDCAIKANSSGITRLLLKNGCHPTKPYLIEECSPQLLGIIQKYCPADTHGRSRMILQGNGHMTAFQAAKFGDLAVIETYYLTGYDFTLKDDDGKQPWQYAIENDWHELLPILGVRSFSKSRKAAAAVKDDGSAVAWGDLCFGGDCSHVQQLMNSGVKSVHSTMAAFSALRADGSVFAWGDADCGGNCKHVQEQLNSDVQSVYSTNKAFAALKIDGTVVVWGHKDYGGDSSIFRDGRVRPFMRQYLQQVGGGNKLINVKAIYATDTAFAAVKVDGTVVSWGRNTDEAEGLIKGDKPSSSTGVNASLPGTLSSMTSSSASLLQPNPLRRASTNPETSFTGMGTSLPRPALLTRSCSLPYTVNTRASLPRPASLSRSSSSPRSPTRASSSPMSDTFLRPTSVPASSGRPAVNFGNKSKLHDIGRFSMS